MKNYLAILLITITCNLTAQEYTPLVVEGAVWVTWYEQEYVDKYHAFEIGKDTVINGTDYYQVIYHELRDGENNPFVIENSYVGGAVREDTISRKVYCRIFFDYFLLSDECRDNYYEGKEFLLYDFNYNVGDTIQSCNMSLLEDYNIVDTIAIQEYFSQMRKVFGFVVDDNLIPILVEGIGNSDGLFAEWNPIISPGDGGTELVAYCLDGPASCNLISNVNDISQGNIDLKIYPNPAYDLLNVTNARFPLAIYSVTGNLIREITEPSSYIKINDLTQGSYYVLDELGTIGRFLKF